ncbi:Carboxylesterase, type B domain-containing protein [Strongyloides ratti]|uniref:Carboxylic ester hydrolase n=1 Tax=Strongyloides ratti TaxID=34506 RepID=A0A090L336_STRRB|nr:Carboxylesterase, type B domain-containing protein [Strongyloides ratti]CEF64127.1 Carboxylesterase, type B domain-containing protein [Strongyloides ratti]
MARISINGKILLLIITILYNLSNNLVYTFRPKASTPLGFYEGFEYKNAYVYLGIRYASPPIGEKRFEKPTVVERHDDIYDASHFGNACPTGHRHEFKYTKQNISEDCLFLNIMTPKDEPKNKSGYPVLVYIHGGGFSFGDSAYLGYKKLVENIVSKGIVVVTIQYRLGFLGFATTGDHVLPGNIGLWDQTYALYFIDGIITSFRGNRDDITISGTSAGSASVGALTISPHSNFMFKRTIQFSGSIFNDFGLSEQSEIYSKNLFESAGCLKKDNLQILQCMKEKTLDELYDAMDKVGIHSSIFTDHMFTPRNDDDFFPGKLDTLIKVADKKPSMIGLATKETSVGLFNDFNRTYNLDKETIDNFDKKSLESFIAQIVLPYDETGRNGGAFRHHLFNFVVDKNPISETATKEEIRQHYLEKLVELTSDISINIGVYHEIQIKLYNGWPIYFFTMDHYNEYMQRNLPVKGATHVAEGSYLFDSDPIPMDKYTEEDKNFEESLSTSISNFIKTGNPSFKNISWDVLTKESSSKHLSFDGKENKIVSDYNSERINFYVKELPKKVGTGILSKTRIPSAEMHRIHTEL